MNQDESWQSITAGALIAAGLVALEHVLLWELRGRLHLVARYTLGTLAIGAGVTFASPRAARVFWPVAIVAGAVVGAAHLARRLMPQPADKLTGGADGVWRVAARHN